ncbi:MAG TPA: glycogen/starch synthase [Candidatus Limnocylindrales bacterium]|nr:glycogen/starch synthase [Candidatus Limnocylindrales bacterium]
MTIRVALLAAECEPWAKTGGLADVVDALARALGRLPEAGSELVAPVDVFLPRYRTVPVPPAAEREPAITVPDPRGGAPLVAGIVNVAADGYRLRLVDVPAAFDRDAYYDFPDDPWRFAVFCRVALAALERDGTPLDVLHVHDWHTGPALIERARGEAAANPFFTGMAVQVTLHNLAYHGWTPNDRLDQLGLRPGDPFAGSNPDGIDLLLTGIERSEIANTVSPTFARESLTPEFGMGLDAALRAKGDRYLGILNGIDPDVWNPATDEALAVPYDASQLQRKKANRADLLERNGMDPADDRIVAGMIGRLDPQKGFDLLADGAPELIAAGARIIVQGSGHASLADPFRALAAANPGRVALIERFDREMARRIYAGADVFLMPSRFEPCGQGQMIALRYGTPPVVRRTGGLADSVIDEDANPGEGTGFVFEDATPAALVDAVARAAARRRSNKAWAALQQRGMAVDFNWDTGSAPRYLETYRRAIALRRGS